MNTFEVFIRSRGIFAGWLSVWLFSFFLVSLLPLNYLDYLPDGEITFIFFSLQALVSFFAYYLAQRAATGRVAISLTPNAIQISWLKNILWHHKSDDEIYFGSIVGYQSAGGTLVLNIAEGSKLRLQKKAFLIGTTSDFDELRDKFEAAFEQFKKTSKDDLGESQLHGATLASQQHHEAPGSNDGQTKTNTYHMESVSVLAAIFFVFIFFIFFIFIALIALALIEATGVFSTWLLMAGFAGAAFITVAMIDIIKRTLTQKMEITLFPECIKVKYTKRPFFDRVRDRTILLSDIRSYKIDSYQGNRTLKLYLTNGTKFYASEGRVDSANEFATMGDAIAQLIEKRNRASGIVAPIARKKSIYEGTSGLILATFLIFVFIALIFVVVFLVIHHNFLNALVATSLIVAVVSRIITIFKLRRKRKEMDAVRNENP